MRSFVKFLNLLFNRYSVINKIGFYINEEYIFDHYLNVFKKMDINNFDIILANKFKKKKYKNFIQLINLNRWNIIFLEDIFLLKKYKILVTHLFLGGDKIELGSFLERLKYLSFLILKKIGINFKKKPLEQYFQKKLGLHNIRFMYGADSGGVKFGKYNFLFDEFFCHGPKDKEIIQKQFNGKVFEMGYPRYDNYNLNFNNDELKKKILKKNNCDPSKLTILWICTVSSHFSTIETYSRWIKKLTDHYNVILRPHPLEIDPQYSRYKKKVHQIVNSGDFIVNTDAYQNMSELYLITDFVMCDYGGSLFSALYLNKKILLMNHKDAYLDEGIYTSESIELRKYLPSINETDAHGIKELFDDPKNFSLKEKYQEARNIYFGNNKSIECSKIVAQKLEKTLRF